MLNRDGEVIGVIPEQLVGWEVAHTGLTELQVVANMHERDVALFDIDVDLRRSRPEAEIVPMFEHFARVADAANGANDRGT